MTSKYYIFRIIKIPFAKIAKMKITKKPMSGDQKNNNTILGQFAKEIQNTETTEDTHCMTLISSLLFYSLVSIKSNILYTITKYIHIASNSDADIIAKIAKQTGSSFSEIFALTSRALEQHRTDVLASLPHTIIQ